MSISICLSSENVKLVFPHGQNRIADVHQGKFLNEYNLRNIIKTVTDNASYVINYDSSSGIIKFVIDGYYFECMLNDNLTTDFSSSSDIYAYIQFTTTTNPEVLQGKDEPDNTFSGIHFVDTIESLDNSYVTLHILEKQGQGSWKVPTCSLKKFVPDSLHIDVIQCKI